MLWHPLNYVSICKMAFFYTIWNHQHGSNKLILFGFDNIEFCREQIWEQYRSCGTTLAWKTLQAAGTLWLILNGKTYNNYRGMLCVPG